MTALDQTNRLFFSASGLDSAKVQGLVEAAMQGGDDGELYLEYAQSEGITWDDGRLRSASFDTTQGFGLRLVCGETVGFAHAVNLDEPTLRRAIASVSAVKGGYGGQMALPPAPTNRLLYDDLNPLSGQTFEAKLALLQKIDAYVRAKDPRVHQVGVSLGAKWQAVQIVRAGAAPVADIRPIVSLNVTVAVKQGERIEEGSYGGGGRVAYDRYFEPEQWQTMADEALRKALVNLDAVDAQAGEMSVVLGSGWPAVLLHEAVGHGLEGDFNRKGASVFATLMGEKIAAAGVTIVDDGTLEDKRGSLTIDDEGTPSQRNVLVEDGRLVGLMQDRLNARLMGLTPTGNGRRESFACQPYPRMTNTMMLGGKHTPEEVIASVDRGIYAVGIEGGAVDITSGKFVFSVSEAYEIEGGKVGRPVKGASLVGTGSEALKHIKMVGNDLKLDNGRGMCGKNGQSVPVGVGQPTLRLDNMTVGGSKVG